MCGKGGALKIPETILIKGGHFMLGDSLDPNSDEYPGHYVFVKDFFLGKYEITNTQYKFFVDDNAMWRKSNIQELKRKKLVDDDYLSHWVNDAYPENLKNNPVTFISWFAATAYCKWLSKISGKNYRLPGEAEWEYAAGNGNKHHPFALFPHKNENMTYADNQGPSQSTRPVGSHPSSPFGLYDMNGNVWELTMSKFKKYPYQPMLSDDMNVTNPEERMVIRGGSFQTYLIYTRVSFRNFSKVDHCSEEIGFRIAYSEN